MENPTKKKLLLPNHSNFGSDNKDDNTPAEDKDKYIPPNDEAELTEAQIAELACLFPTTASIKPKVLPLDAFPSLANQMSSIMSTTTHVPTSVLARTVGAGIPGRAAVPMGSTSTLIGRTLGESQVDYLLKLPTCLEEMLEEFCLELHHLLVEVVEAVEAVVVVVVVEEPLEEGEIHPNKYP